MYYMIKIIRGVFPLTYIGIHDSTSCNARRILPVRLMAQWTVYMMSKE